MVIRGKKGSLDPVSHMQLGQEAAEIVLDRLFTQVKGASDFFIAQAASQAIEDLFLTWTQPNDLGRVGRAAGDKQQLCSQAWENVTFTGLDAANAFNELRRGYSFQGIAGNPSAQECHHCI